MINLVGICLDLLVDVDFWKTVSSCMSKSWKPGKFWWWNSGNDAAFGLFVILYW